VEKLGLLRLKLPNVQQWLKQAGSPTLHLIILWMGDGGGRKKIRIFLGNEAVMF